jgi:hypothetical protein
MHRANTHAQLAGHLWPRQAGGAQPDYSSGIQQQLAAFQACGPSP